MLVLNPKGVASGNAPGCGLRVERPAQNLRGERPSEGAEAPGALRPLWPLASVPPPIGLLPIATPSGFPIPDSARVRRAIHGTILNRQGLSISQFARAPMPGVMKPKARRQEIEADIECRDGGGIRPGTVERPGKRN